MKKFAKLLTLLLCFAVALTATACGEVKIESIGIDGTSTVAYSQGNLTMPDLLVTFDDGTSQTIPFSRAMISDEDYAKLSTFGSHEITVRYEGFSTSFEIIIVGEKGDKGDTGTGISNVSINESGELVIEYSDGSSTVLGKVTGEQGIQGEQGNPGDQGDPGTPGENGVGIVDAKVENGKLYIKYSNAENFVDLGSVKGDKGDQGDQGIQGNPGDDGENGKSAYEIAVANGFEGDEAAWLKSLVGAQGAQGEQGKQGDTGAKGDAGVGIVDVKIENGKLYIKYSNAENFVDLGNVKGEKGDQGDQGIQGNPGDDGENGKSAYEIAVANGFEGTEAAWLESLKGAQGEQGIQGEQGNPGAQGDKGEQGEKGDKGEVGMVGFVITDWNQLAAAASVYNSYIILACDIASSDSENNNITISAPTKDLKFVLDLNGYRIDGELFLRAENGYKIDATIINGTIGSETGKSANGVTVRYAFVMFGNDADVKLENVNMFGHYAGYYENGRNSGSKITAVNCEFAGVEGISAYTPGNHTAVYENCVFTGYTYIKSGTRTFKNCEITSTIAYEKPVYHGSGAKGGGSAIVVDSALGYQDTLVVTIDGCTLVSSDGYGLEEVSTAPDGKEKVSYATVTITNSTLSGTKGAYASENNVVSVDAAEQAK